MEFAVIILIVLTVAAFAMWLRAGQSRSEAVLQASEAREALDKARSEVSELKGEIARERERVGRVKGELAEARTETKNHKKRAHDAAQELREAESRLEELRGKQAAMVGVEESREQLMVAMTENANLRTQIAQLRAELASHSVSTDEVTPSQVDASATDSVDELRAQVSRLQNQVRQQARELTKSFDEQVGKERRQVREELRDMRRRLGRALTDLDKERRRADNNDKAYLIMKGQLESALDRLSRVDQSLRRPDQVDPAELVRPAEPATPAVVVADPEAAAQGVDEAGPGDEVQESSTPSAAREAQARDDVSESAPTSEAAADAVADVSEASGVAADEKARPALTGGAAELGDDGFDADGWDLDDETLARVSGSHAAVTED